jgi:hypothetical protein
MSNRRYRGHAPRKGEDKKMITALFTCAGLLLTMGTALAQAPKTETTAAQITDLEVSLMRKDLRDQKKQVVAANLPLNGDEAAGFWPLYDAYTQETVRLNDQRYALVKEYAENYSSMTDDQASGYIQRWIQADDATSKLRLDWMPKFEKVLGNKKTAMFFQIDRRVGLMTELQLSSQLPLIQP